MASDHGSMEHVEHADHHAVGGHDDERSVTAVLQIAGMHFASEKTGAERVLGRRPGVLLVEVNPVAQTATVTFDAHLTSLAELRDWVQECGYHCAGRSVPNHICDAMEEPRPAATSTVAATHAAHDMGAMEPAGHHQAGADALPSPHDAMGQGGHGGMSMESMVRDMRNRFLIAAVLSLLILLWSRIGREVLGFTVAAPFGLRDDLFQLILSIPVVFYAGWIFFDGAFRALRARTLDMMVLVAVGVGAGWGYSLVVSLGGGGEVFYGRFP